jgi:acetylornithine/N-succinyldiaminopimelate aminotransferase
MAAEINTDHYLEISEAEIKALEEKYLFPTYKRYDLVLSHGQGPYVYDFHGNKYLDFLGGIAVNSLGYNHPRLTRVLNEQGRRIIHGSNLFYHSFQGKLAQRLAEISGLERVFFTNSGTEAMEGALKIARAYARKQGHQDKTGIIALKNSFHGRTFGALSITAQEKYQAPFRPLVPDVTILEDISISALEQAFGERTCAIVMEPIQGEGGVVPIPDDFIHAARALCDRYDAVLILDEIQTGMGRTGKYFAYQHLGVQPDIVTVAKSLAAGYPLGAIIGSHRMADALKPGEHGTTFGGGPLACRLALEVLDVIKDENLLENASFLGSRLLEGLRGLSARHQCIGEVRGRGCMVGTVLGALAKDAVQSLMAHGVLANAAHESVLRLLPPFIISGREVDLFLDKLDTVLSKLKAK